MCNKALKVKLSQKKSEAQHTVKASEGSGHQLTESAAEKDLGILIDKQLSFKDHVANITSKANWMLCIIWSTFDYIEEDTFITLYKSLVCTILEYGYPVWQPYHRMLCGTLKVFDDVPQSCWATSMTNPTFTDWDISVSQPWNIKEEEVSYSVIDAYKYIHGI